MIGSNTLVGLPAKTRCPDGVPAFSPKIHSGESIAASIVKPPATSRDAFAGKAVVRTRDEAHARQRLANAVQATVWCDGSCEPNPGLMGWGVVVQSSGEQIELHGGGRRGTNNAAELSAVLVVLECLPTPCNTIIVSDSQYLIFGMTRWMAGWRQLAQASQSRMPIFGAGWTIALRRVQFRAMGQRSFCQLG